MFLVIFGCYGVLNTFLDYAIIGILGAVAVTKLGRNHPQSFILRLLVVIQLHVISIIFCGVGVLNADRGGLFYVESY